MQLPNGLTEAECLEICKEKKESENASGCEYYAPKRKCAYHTMSISKGSGDADYLCWNFATLGMSII